eukprot:CAMPEP_0184867720 /NCGR_PEP_ID=MMETSP0580-20130426/27542_1 /TAXON_ID=1118495 /ORGANISM="Dactyliosolen fragilissimus" /LENGTH=908 /DNA_ID=CAMNT_0027368153 /DNA_START=343 /DNA_END=3069 /DNA_ORIENTATION=+
MSKDSILSEVPEWVYNSRPGNDGSFFPHHNRGTNSKDCSDIVPIVDPFVRVIFALQNNNKTLSTWSLDTHVDGPDDRTNNIHKYNFSSSVVAMELLPSQKRKIMFKDGNEDIIIQSGIVGLLTNGQIFLALIVSSSGKNQTTNTLVVNTFNPNYQSDQSLSLNGKKKSESHVSNVLFSMATLSKKEEQATANSEGVSSKIGTRKRKHTSYTEHNTTDDDYEVTFRTMAHNKDDNCMILSKYSIVISSCTIRAIKKSNGEKVDQSKQIFSLEYDKLPISQNRDEVNNLHTAKTAQLDRYRLAVVFQAKNTNSQKNMWYCSVYDIRHGDCIINPFPILSECVESVLSVGGLSNMMLAFLTNKDNLMMYDLRKRVLVHTSNVKEIFIEGRTEMMNKDDVSFSMCCHWFSGTIALIHQPGAGADKFLSIKMAQVGNFEEDVRAMGNNNMFNSRPLHKGIYNLADIIKSNICISSKTDVDFMKVEIKDLNDLYCGGDISKELTPRITISQAIKGLRDSEKTDDLIKDKDVKSFDKKFFEYVSLLSIEKIEDVSNEANWGNQQGNGYHHSTFQKNEGAKSKEEKLIIPDTFYNCAISVALKFLLTKCSRSRKIGALKVLIECMKRGKVFARSHFDLLKNEKLPTGNSVLRALYFSLKNVEIEENGLSFPGSLFLMKSLLRCCNSSLSEDMLVTSIHHILCHTSSSDLSKSIPYTFIDKSQPFWKKMTKLQSNINHGLKEISVESSDEKKLNIKKLQDQLAMAQRLAMISHIVTSTKCNGTLLRSALKYGLISASDGEVELLLSILIKLLHRKNEFNHSIDQSKRIIQWASALMDSFMGRLMNSTLLKTSVNLLIEVKKSLTSAIEGSETFYGLIELLKRAESKLRARNALKDNEEKNVVMKASVPRYGIEPLIF